MTACGLDLRCYISDAFFPILSFWQSWDWLVWFVFGLIIGGILGWRVVLAVLTLGIGYFLYDRMKKDGEPVETDLPARDREPPPKKPKRKTLF